tara:strand:+ start:489 stop:1739 length:1251 start_codon:yes stop_codon:yes gene_type:complete
MNLNISIYNFIKKSYFTKLYSLFISSLVFFSYITLNFEYHRIISPWTELKRLTHSQLFNEVIISVFKPFLHIEKISGDLCGYECVYFANKITWVLLTFLISFLLIKRLRDYFINGSSRIIKCLSFLIATSFPFLIRWASWGTIVDPLYALGIFLLLMASNEFFILKNNNSFIKKPTAKRIAYAVIGVLIIDLSRPYGFFAICLFGILFIYKKSYKLIFSLLLGLLLAMPYHVVHYKKTGNLLLSNFTGCYLAQVTRPENYTSLPYEKKGFESQLEILEICNRAKKDIISEYYLSNPKLTIQKIFQLSRIKKIIFPSAFAPYKVTSNIFNPREFLDLVVTIILYIFYCSVIIILLVNLKNSKMDIFTIFILCTIILLPFFSSFIAHNGKESLRHTFHYYLPMLFLSLQFNQLNIRKN